MKGGRGIEDGTEKIDEGGGAFDFEFRGLFSEHEWYNTDRVLGTRRSGGMRNAKRASSAAVGGGGGGRGGTRVGDAIN